MKYLILLLLLSSNCLFAQSTVNLQGATLPGNNIIASPNSKQYNNNYTDPNYSPDSVNFVAEFIDAKKDRIAIYPKTGTWSNTFFWYPPELVKINRDLVFSYCFSNSYVGEGGDGSNTIIYKNKTIPMLFNFTNAVSTKTTPLCIPIPNPNCFFIFGDYNDGNKMYVYDYGKLYWLPHDKNIIRVK